MHFNVYNERHVFQRTFIKSFSSAAYQYDANDNSEQNTYNNDNESPKITRCLNQNEHFMCKRQLQHCWQDT